MATHLRMRSATPSVYFDLEKGVLTMIDCQKDCGRKSYSSGDFKQEETSAYNYNVLAVNCEQDWKVSGHCSILLSPLKIIPHRGRASYMTVYLASWIDPQTASSK